MTHNQTKGLKLAHEVKLSPTIEQIRAHASVRNFTPDPVPDDWIETIVETAQWASTSCFRQMYSVIAIKDRQTKHELAVLCGGQRWIDDCAVFLAFCADLNRLDEICKTEAKTVHMDYTETFLAAVLDVGLFMQNAALSAESLGLGMVMIGGLRDHPREIIRLLGLPRGVFGVSGMCLGFPAVKPARKPRLPVDEVLHWERYNSGERSGRLAAYDESIRSAGIYKTIDGERRSWTAVMARTSAKAPAEEGRRRLREVLQEQGYVLE